MLNSREFSGAWILLGLWSAIQRRVPPFIRLSSGSSPPAPAHQSALGTYDAVYLRPFNFRSADQARRQNAVQYMASPEYDWPRLRQEFPGEFEKPVDASVEPTGWVPLRIVVKDRTVQVYVGAVTSPTLEVRKLGPHDRGMIGLWTGNNSDGAFANLRVMPAR